MAGEDDNAQPGYVPPLWSPDLSGPPPPPLTPEEASQIEIDPAQPQAMPAPMGIPDSALAGYHNYAAQNWLPPQPPTPEQHALAGIAQPVTAEQPVAQQPTPEQQASIAPTQQLLPSAQDMAQYGAAKTPEERIAALRAMGPDDRAKLVPTMDPLTYGGYLAMRQSDAVADINKKNAADAEQGLARREQLLQQTEGRLKAVDDDAARIANTKIDSRHVWKSMGTGQKIGLAVASIFGGIAAAYNHTSNTAMDQFNRSVDQDIEDQKANLANQREGNANKRNLVLEEYARHGDLLRAQESVRQAQYLGAMNDLNAELVKRDPQGSQAIAIRQGIGSVQQQIVANQQVARKQMLEEGAQQLKGFETISTIRKNEAETAKLQGGPGGGTAVAPPAQVLPQSYYQGIGLPVPPADMSVDAYNKWTSMRKAGGEADKAQTEAEATKTASTIQDTHGTALIGEDNKPIVMPVTEATEINKKIIASQQSLDALSDVRRALSRPPEQFDRNQWAGIQARVGTLLPRLAEMYGSKFSSREEEALKDITHLDFDSFWAKAAQKGQGIASIDAFVKSIKLDGDTMLKGIKYKGPSIWIDTSRPPETVLDEVDKAGQTLSTKPDVDLTDLDSIAGLHQQVSSLGMPAAHATGLAKLESLLSSGITQHSGQWFIVDGQGQDTSNGFDTREAALKQQQKLKDKALGVLRSTISNAPYAAVQNRATAIVNAYDLANTVKP